MIYHSGDLNLSDYGRAVTDNGEWQGFNVLVSPKPLPPPVTQSAIDYHLRHGAILVYVLREPELFGTVNDMLALQKEYNTQINQRMLLLAADGEARQIYQEPARQWMMAGGVSHILPDLLDLGLFLQKLETGAEREPYTTADWISILPSIDKRTASILADEYGPKVIELLSVSTEPEQETILNLPGLEGLSLADLRKIRDFLELGSKQELRVIEISDDNIAYREQTREFYRLANELGGEVIEE